MDAESAQLTLQFLERVSLSAPEIPAFLKVQHQLQQLTTPAPPEAVPEPETTAFRTTRMAAVPKRNLRVRRL